MTVIRKAALNIVQFVIRSATPASRVWAQAMLGELSYIKCDWTALRWALGSMHVLFTSPGGHTMTMSELPAATKALTGRMTRRTWAGSVVVIAMAVFFARLLLRVPDTLQRMGCAFLVVAMLYMLFQLVSARPHTISIESDPVAQAAHYCSELKREWNFHRGFSFWSRLAIIIPGFLMLAIGRMIAIPGSVTINAVQVTIFLLFAALTIPKSERFANQYAAQMQNVKQLQHEQRSEA